MKAAPPRPVERGAQGPRRRLLQAALALLSPCLAAPAAFAQAATGSHAARAGGFDLPALAALLRRRTRAEARFTEERFVSGLDFPLRASGTLSFSAPDRFARHTLQPRPESMTVEGDTVTLQRGGRTRRMPVDAAPDLTALVAALRGTFNGDLKALQEHFSLQLSGDAKAWRLQLRPQNNRLGAQVVELLIDGQGGELRRLELLLSGGDRSVMRIEPLPLEPPAPPPAPPAEPVR